MRKFVLFFGMLYLLASCAQPSENQTPKNEGKPAPQAEETSSPKEAPEPNPPGREAMEPVAPGFPFGMKLDEMGLEIKENGGMGDCYGAYYFYRQEELELVLDSTSCGDYGTTSWFYLMNDGVLEKAHVQEVNVDFDNQGDDGNYLWSEKVYSITAEPPVMYSRSGRQGSPDFEPQTGAFKVEELQNATGIRDSIFSAYQRAHPIPDHYICYTSDGQKAANIMIAFDATGTAMFLQYEGQEGKIELEFVSSKMTNDGAYPTTTNVYDEILMEGGGGSYSLVHAGNWDYVEYVKGGKEIFNFTIDHELTVDGDGYRTTPCF